jgi:hypothetical protein
VPELKFALNITDFPAIDLMNTNLGSGVCPAVVTDKLSDSKPLPVNASFLNE